MQFHISDILSITTGRLVSNRHIEGIYAILNHMTGDNLFTHQLPRATRECEPILAAAYPQLSKNDPVVAHEIKVLSYAMANYPDDVPFAILGCVSRIQAAHGLPEMLEVAQLFHGESSHADPMEELEQLVGKDRIIKVEL